MSTRLFFLFLILYTLTNAQVALANDALAAQPEKVNGTMGHAIFDDKMLLEGYSRKYQDLSKDVILAIISDENISAYKNAAAVRVFRDRFSLEIVSREKRRVEKKLLRSLHRSNSPFVQVEIMHTLARLDRYRYFKSMVPGLIQKLDHYNETVNELAFDALNDIIEAGQDRSREARIIFNTLRKVLFLSRKRLANVKEADVKLTQKIQLVRWSIKILGTQELKKLPKEVINLL